MTKHEKQEFWITFRLGMIIGAFIGLQVWIGSNLYRCANRSGEVMHNYLYE